jgi:hypothetical protein
MERSRCASPSTARKELEAYLSCGLLCRGFARLKCEDCGERRLVAFSCRGRSFCPSCEKKKQLLWAEWLREEVLLPVAHRHVVLTIPRLLRPLFRRRRELLGEPARAGAEAVKELSLLCRLATSVPPPRFHTLRYAGVLAAASPWRPQIAPKPPTEEPAAASAELDRTGPAGGYRPWAELLARTFAVDVLACPKCHGRMRLLAMVEEPRAPPPSAR